MHRRRGHSYFPPKPRYTKKNSIDDFPLVPEPPINIIAAPVHNQPNVLTSMPLRPLPTPPAPPPPNVDAVSEPLPPQAPPPAPPIESTPPTAVAPPVQTTPEPPNEDSTSVPAPMDPDTPAPVKKPAKKRRPRRKKPAAEEQPIAASAPPRDHHQRHCSVCNHPDRDAIEEQFAHWHSISDIALAYHIHYRAIHRHAHYAGLFRERERNVRSALGHIIDWASKVRPSADAIIRAVHAFTRINDEGQWTEPPTHVVVSSGSHRVMSDSRLQTVSAMALPAAVRLENLPPAPLSQLPPPSSANPDPVASTRPGCAKLLDTHCRVESNVTY